MQAALRLHRRPAARPVSRTAPVTLRQATVADAHIIHGLIVDHLAEGHLLPRERAEIGEHVHRFIVATQGTRVIACAELAPLSSAVAEVRSFVVSRDARNLGLGTRLVDALYSRAQDAGFATLCAFTHSPGYFVRLGFAIVPHQWLPEKIATDCVGCRHFQRCGQYAVSRTVNG